MTIVVLKCPECGLEYVHSTLAQKNITDAFDYKLRCRRIPNEAKDTKSNHCVFDDKYDDDTYCVDPTRINLSF